MTEQVFPQLSAVPDAVQEQFEAAFRKQQQATHELWVLAHAAWQSAARADRPFVDDELALIMTVHPATAESLLADACLAADLPALMTAWEAGHLSDRHVKAAVSELHSCLTDPALRIQVLDRVLTRCRDRVARSHGWPTPGELRRMIRTAALLLDLDAAQRREDEARVRRGVHSYPLPHGQAALSLEGPQEQVLVMAAAIRAQAEAMGRDPGDDRTLEQREFDAAYALLTGGTGDGDDVQVEAQVVVPIATATGERHELGELPGMGPVLPGTCRRLLAGADTLRRICVDAVTGRVLAVDDAVRVDRDPTAIARALEQMRTDPVVVRDLSTDAYRPTRRAVAFVRTRDRTCRFPGCTRPARYADIDHRDPWPHGRTSPENLHALCRHHHRAKQSGLFTVCTEPDGTTVWTTRSGRQYRRPPPTLCADPDA